VEGSDCSKYQESHLIVDTPVGNGNDTTGVSSSI
jgi:hypothetical protein